MKFRKEWFLEEHDKKRASFSFTTDGQLGRRVGRAFKGHQAFKKAPSYRFSPTKKDQQRSLHLPKASFHVSLQAQTRTQGRWSEMTSLRRLE